VPSGLRILSGTDKKGRSGRRLDRSHEPVAPDGDLVPPCALSEEKQAIWDKTVADLESMGIASSADVNQIFGYVDAVALHRRSSRQLDDQPLVIDGYRSPVANKLVTIKRQAAGDMLRFAQEFGLTPSARTRVDAGPYPGGGRGGGAKKPNPFAGPFAG
jgi:P27 family predicted phage terminase small subunit